MASKTIVIGLFKEAKPEEMHDRIVLHFPTECKLKIEDGCRVMGRTNTEEFVGILHALVFFIYQHPSVVRNKLSMCWSAK